MMVGYTITEWLNTFVDQGNDDSSKFLASRYRSSIVEDKRQEYTALLREARDSRIFSITTPVVITAAPGRIRGFGGHIDAPGLMVDAVGMATEEEILMVVQSFEDERVVLVNADPKRGRKEFSVDDPGVKATRKISNSLEWDSWAKAEADAGNVSKDRDKDWDIAARAMLAFYGGKYFGEREFPGLRAYIGRTDLPMGGVSSSSAIVMGYNYAIDFLSSLGQTISELVYNGFCESTYFGQACGIGDHAIIAHGKRGEMVIMGSSPGEPKGTVSFPDDLSPLIFDSGISREMDMRYISNKFRQEFEDEKGDGNIVNRRSGRGCALASLWIRHRFAQLERGMTHYETKSGLADNAVVGYLRELLPGGQAELHEQDLFGVIGVIPERISRDDLYAALGDRFTSQLDDLFKNHPEPRFGYRLREAAIYGFSEGERVRLFVEACSKGDVDMIMGLQRKGHDGDRVTRYNIVIGDDGNVDPRVPTETPFYPSLSDVELSELTRGCCPQKHIWQCAGTFERSLEPIDYFCDLVDAWSRRTGIEAAARISAAGLGGAIAVFCEKRGAEQLTDFLQRNYYGKFDQIVDRITGSGYRSDYVFDPTKTVRSFSPGQGAAIVDLG